MTTLGLLLMVLALIVSLATGVWLLVIAGQQKKYVWMALMLLVPFAALVFVVLNWSEAKKPFLISLAALPLYIAGFFMGLRGAMIPAQMEMVSIPRTQASRPGAAFPSPRPQPPARPVEPVRVDPAPEPTPAPAPEPPPAVSRPAPQPVAQAKEPPRVVPPEVAPAPPPKSDPPATIAAAEPQPEAAAAPPAARQQPPTAPAKASEVRVDFVQILQPSAGLLRSVRLRIVNPSDRAVLKVRMLVGYLERSGRELRSWVTEHADPEKPVLVGANATREFDCPAFFMPETTASAYVRIREIEFADGSVWRP